MSDEIDETVEEVGDLELQGAIGFDGTIIKGLILHPDGQHAVFPIGNKVIIHHIEEKQQQFLTGHTNTISAIDVSRSGKYVASGQINHIGFKARVIVWDFFLRTILSQHELHKVRVEAVSFSNNDAYLFSLGGRDCGSLIVWDVALGQVICGTQAAHGVQGEATTLLSMNRRSPCFMTGGDNHLAMWTVDKEARKVHLTDVSIGKLKRNIYCVDVNERDEICYCGTATGDVLKIRLNYHHDTDILEPVKLPVIVGCFTRISKKKLPEGTVDLYSLGVKSIKRLFKGPLLIGAGDGTLDLVEEMKIVTPSKKDFGWQAHIKMPSFPALKILKSTNVNGAVTSLQLRQNDTIIIAGTSNCEVYSVDMKTFDTLLLITCHSSPIYDLAFPYDFSEVFATAGKHSVRIWSMKTFKELLRIQVQNFSASSVVFSHDGKSVLTAWNDGIIRSFTPLTGKLIYAILNAHNKGVSALATNHEGDILISGGCEGQVRLWSVSPYRQQLVCTLKEHKAPVSAIDVNKAGIEAVSASTDGTCIIWDLVRQCRRQILFGTTLFMCARYYPTDVQILTGGSDRKLSYWEVLDGCLVREIEGSQSGAINTLDISKDGSVFITGGNDQIVKLWDYQTGVTTHIGIGHTGVITSARFSPDQKYMATASASGGVFIWKCPIDFSKKQKEEADDTVEGQETPKKQEEQKDEVIHDLPSVRSENSDKSDNKRECRCQCSCPNKNVSARGTDADKAKSPKDAVPKRGPKGDENSARSVKSLSMNGTPKK